MGFISFHIEQSEIFHNFRKIIISHSASPNISPYLLQYLRMIVLLCERSEAETGSRAPQKRQGTKYY
jgi:hypothetical protein